MKDCLERLPQEVRELIYEARDEASLQKVHAYLVGGFVRDLLLGVPNLDLDFVVEGDGIRVAEGLSSRLKAKLIRHRRFGTATLICKPHLKIDIASARKELYPHPACLPQVSPGSLQDDLFRRDFAINAMALSIHEQGFGKLIDFFYGKEDLKNRKIRILHDLSFLDDPTRILRAIRFEQRYNFKIEPRTLQCLRQAVKKNMITAVEPQRLRDDLILILKESHPLKAIRRLEELAGLRFISQELSLHKKTCALLSSIEKQINWFKKAHHQHRSLDAWLIYFMGLLDSLSIGEIKGICRRFAFRRGEEKRIMGYKKMNPNSLKGLYKKDIKPSRIFAFLEPLSYEVILLLKSKYKNFFFQKYIEDFLNEYNHARIHICGRDLHGYGVRPGPAYQKIFVKILKAKLDGLVKTREEELQLARNFIEKAK